MAGRNRRIDPLTKDYVADGSGSYTYDDDPRTVIYGQVMTRKGQWWGNPEAGSRLWELARAKSHSVRAPQTVRDVWSELLRPLVERGRIEEGPEVSATRTIDRIDLTVTVRDPQTGDPVELTDLLPLTT